MRRLGSLSREPIRSIAAALEQMLARVNALRNSNSSNARRGPGAAGDDAVQGEEGYRRAGDVAAADEEGEEGEEEEDGHHRMSPAAPAFGQGSAAAAAAVPLHGGGGGAESSDDVLDELWSMTDWDMSFPLLDFQSYAPR